MKTPSMIEKLKLVHKKNIDSFITRYGIAYPNAKKIKTNGVKRWVVPKRGKRQGKCIFVTMTFNKRIYEKKQAEFIKHDFMKKLKVYTPFEYCCVPELHTSEAYHFHLLIALYDDNLTLHDLKERIRRLKFIGFVTVEWTWGDIENVSWYLVQYLTAENLNAIKGRSISYSRGFQRVANTRFAWVNTPWRTMWKHIEIVLEHLEKTCPSGSVKEYYSTVICRSGSSDRLAMIELFKNQDIYGMYDYVTRGIKDYVQFKGVSKPFLECLPELREVEQIMRDSREFQELLEVPF